MGLTISHEAYDGGYLSFNRLRAFVLESIGGEWPKENFNETEQRWYWRKDHLICNKYNSENYPGLYEFFCHSDCGGEIQPNICFKIANELNEIMSLMEEHMKRLNHDGGGHISQNGGYIEVIKQFIKGCLLAYEENEPLEFY